MQSPLLDTESILRALVEKEVEFIVVGGICAVFHGVLVTTQDLDILHKRTPENIERLLEALSSIDARFRVHHDIRPEASHLEGPGHALLITNAGDLDVLGSIGNDRTYLSLEKASILIEMDGLRFRILDLPNLIASKEEAGRPKDLAVLPLLKSYLHRHEERNRDSK